MQADGGEHGSGCYEDRASVKTPATHSQRRIRRHLPEIGGEVQQRPGQRRDAKSESDRGRDGGKSVARRLEWGMRVGSAAFNGVGYRQEVPGTAPCKEGDYGSNGGETGAAGGDNRSRMVSGITSRKAMAPQQQPARRGALGEDEAVDSRDVGGSKPAGIAAAADERDPILMDSDLEKDDAGQKKALLQGSKEGFVHGNRGQLSLATEERTTPSPVQQYFDEVGRTLDQVDGPHDGLHETAAALLSGFACVIHAGWDAVLDMGEQVVALERERDALRASLGETAAAEGTEDDVPAWLRDAEDLLQGLAGEDANAAARTRTSEREAKDRVESFFAKAIAEEAWHGQRRNLMRMWRWQRSRGGRRRLLMRRRPEHNGERRQKRGWRLVKRRSDPSARPGRPELQRGGQQRGRRRSHHPLDGRHPRTRGHRHHPPRRRHRPHRRQHHCHLHRR